MIKIPNYKDMDIKNIICDYNGTIAKDGQVLASIQELFAQLKDHYSIYVITADTFGSVDQQLDDYGVEVKVLTSSDHTGEKESFVNDLGAESCIAIGNGNNDASMLKTAALGVAIIGDEGCSTESLLSSDIVCRSIAEALELALNPKRVIATLRK